MRRCVKGGTQMKRFISCLLAVALLLTLVMPVAMAADERTSGAFTYRIKGNGNAIITGYDWKNNEGEDIYIPRMIDGYAVTEIGDSAFGNKYCPSQKAGSLVIPDTIISIGSHAFHGIHFASKSISIPASVQHIGYGAFSGLENVEQFTVDTNNQIYATIDGLLYDKVQKELISYPRGKHEEKIIIPEGIKSIGDYSVSHSGGREEVILLPNTLERIGDYSFWYASFGLASSSGDRINTGVFPSSLSELGEFAFCRANLYGDVNLANTAITVIPKQAFGFCTIEGTLSLPKRLVEIGESAFRYQQLKIGEFPKTLETIGDRAFQDVAFYCQDGDIYSLFFPFDSELTFIGDGAFLNCNFDTVILPEGLKSIGKAAFAEGFLSDEEKFSPETKNGYILETLSLPASLRSIGDDLCTRTKVILNVPDGSYAAMWASENGYITQRAGTEDTSWLND